MLPLSNKPTSFRVAMTTAEADLYGGLVANADRIVEFGSGGSTLLAVRSRARAIVSVESGGAWIESVANHPEIVEALSAGRLQLIHANIGPTGEWAYPTSSLTKPLWPNYPLAPWAHAARAANNTLYLVDGRFRVACAAQCYLHAAADTRIAFHDFWDRAHYHIVLDIFDLERRVDNLAVFVAKPGKESLARDIFERHQYDVR